MKKLIPFFVFFFIFSFPVSATTITPPVRNQERKEIRQETIEEIKEIRQEKKEDISQLRKQRLEVTYKAIRLGLTKRYEAILKNKAIIDTRIAKRSLEGKDMTTAKEKLAGFDQLETNYKSHLAAFDSKYVELSNSEKPSQLLAGLKSSVALVKADLKSMHQLFINVIKLIIAQK